MQQMLEQIIATILEQETIAIISHNNPDGDTLGSQVALAMAVQQYGVKTILLNNDYISKKYDFIAEIERIRPYIEGEPLPEVVIFVDCSTLELAGYTANHLALQGKMVINLDHHASNIGYGTLNYINITAGANCQNIYELLRKMGAELTPEIATALYMGLSTDTGNFLYDNTTSDTLRIAAELKDCGAETNQVRLRLYESCSKSRLELQRYIYQHLQFSSDGAYAWSHLEYDMLEALHANSTDIDGLINTIKSIDGVEVAMLFRGVDEEKIKVSLRSKSWADVTVIAGQFGGGGHVRASGCTMECTMEEAITKMADAVSNYLKAGQNP